MFDVGEMGHRDEVMGDICLNITITHTTADSQAGQEKPALQETWVGPRQTAASLQSFYITSSQLEGCLFMTTLPDSYWLIIPQRH